MSTVTLIPLVVLIVLCFVLAFVVAIYIYQEREMIERKISQDTRKKEIPNSN